jgi:hypothetical protein
MGMKRESIRQKREGCVRVKGKKNERKGLKNVAYGDQKAASKLNFYIVSNPKH